MAAFYGGFLLLVCQIALLWQGSESIHIHECVYEELSTGREITQICSNGCCETDCCDDTSTDNDDDSTDSTQTIIIGAIAGSVVFVSLIILATCRLVPSCPLAKYRRRVIIRRTTIVARRPGNPAIVTRVPPSNFQNPLASPPVGVTVPQGPPPSYDQAVAPTFTPLPATVPVHQGPASNKI